MEPIRQGRLADGGGGPYDGAMEARVQRLEELAIETKERLARIEAQMATKGDVQAAINALIKWMVGTAVGIGVAAVTIVTFVLNNAVPKPAPAPAVTIQLPAEWLRSVPPPPASPAGPR